MFDPRISRTFSGFLRQESGAVTVDWVVLTAAIVGIGIAATAAVRTGTSALGNDVSASLSSASVASLDCLGANTGPAGFECYTGPTITSAISGYGFATGGSCTASPGGPVVCGDPVTTMVVTYAMSDGSTYNETTRTVGSQDPVVTWTNGDGDEVDAPPPQS